MRSTLARGLLPLLLLPACALEVEGEPADGDPPRDAATDAASDASTLAPPPCTHHVATTGSNLTGDASRAAPWQTLQYALDHVGPGARVCAAVGTYHEHVFVNVSGTAAQPITLTRDPDSLDPIAGGEVIVDGTILTPNYGECPPALWILGQSHLRISNLTVINHGNAGFPGPNFALCPAGGIWIGTWHAASAEDIVISNTTIREINPPRAEQLGIPAGMSSYIPGLSVHHVQFVDNTFLDSDTVSEFPNSTGGLMVGALTVAGDVHDFEIRHNTFDDPTTGGVEMGGNQNGTNLTPMRGVVADNVFHTSGNQTGTYAVYLQAAQQIDVERNYFDQVGRGVGVLTEPPCGVAMPVLAGHDVIRNNVFANTRYSDLVIGAFPGSNVCLPDGYRSVDSVYFTNNTIYRPTSAPDAPAIFAPRNGDNTITGDTRILDNMILTSGLVFDLAQQGGLVQAVVDYNYLASPLAQPVRWNGVAMSFADWRATQHDTHSKVVPSITTSVFTGPVTDRSGFHLSWGAGAPPRNAGAPAVAGLPATTAPWASFGAYAPLTELDHYGGARDNGKRDLGADEY